MKKRAIAGCIVLALVVVGAAGYTGLHAPGTEGAEAAAQAPTTVTVTRGDVQQTVTAPGQLTGTRQAELALNVSGKLVEVTIRPGEPVHAGDVLARIDPAPLEDKVAAAQSALATAQAQLAQLEAGPSEAVVAAAQLAVAQAEADLHRLKAAPTAAEVAAAEAEVAAAKRDLAILKSKPDPAGVAQAEAELERANVVLQQAQAAYDQVRDRPDVGMLPQARALQEATIGYQAAEAGYTAAKRSAAPAEVEAAQARLAAAQAALAQLQKEPPDEELRLGELNYAQAQAELAQITAGPSAAELKQAQATVQAADLVLKLAKADLAATALRAPFDGVILEVRANPGDTVAAGAGLIVLTDPTAVEVEASVIEEDLPLVRIGQEVDLFFDAEPDAEAHGHVARIVPQRLPGDRPLYPVYIALDRLPEGLLAGMSADASIVVASRNDVLCLPRALVRAKGDGTATVEIWDGSQTSERQVQAGLRGDVYVEIAQGLREGEQVVAR